MRQVRAVLLLGFAAALAGCTPKPVVVTPIPQPDPPVLPVSSARGFADLHNHQFNHLSSGGYAIYGEPWGSSENVLSDCSWLHGPWGIHSAMERFHPARCGRYAGHLTSGWQAQRGWPNWFAYIHQQVYEPWLRRANLGGLRLMVMVAGNSPDACGFIARAPGRNCDDMTAVDLQLRAAKAFERYVDQQAGFAGSDACDVAAEDCPLEFHGDRPGWYRIVYTSQQALDTIRAGKLAVVLGIEVPGLFGCTSDGRCDAGRVTTEVNRYAALGVRHLFPVHNTLNAFAGPAIFNDSQGTAFGPPVGEDFDCSDAGYRYVRKTSLCGFPVGVRCAKTGLTELGKHLVHSALNAGIFVDVDHLSARARADVLTIAEQRQVPLLSGHTDFLEPSMGADGKNEAALTVAELKRLRGIGGLVAPIINPGPIENVSSPCVYWNNWASSAEFAKAYQHAVAHAGGPVALGSDFNGFLLLPRPRFQPDGCFPRGAQGPAETAYPFKPLVAPPASAPLCSAGEGCACITDAGLLAECRFGGKTYDVNVDGLPHVGLLPDFLEDVRVQLGSSAELEPLMQSAEAFSKAWAKLEAGRGGPVAPPAPPPEGASQPLELAGDGGLGQALLRPAPLGRVRGKQVRALPGAAPAEYLRIDGAGCATTEVKVTVPAGQLMPVVEVLDERGNVLGAPIAGGPDGAPGSKGVHTNKAFNVRVMRPASAAGELRYEVSLVSTPDAVTGPEVCDGKDNDCNGRIDDCGDPECADADRDGIANCVDADDDDDCVTDTNDNCRLVANANPLCPQANGDLQACDPCRSLRPFAHEKHLLENWVMACGARPQTAACRTRSCTTAEIFGGARAGLVDALVARPGLVRLEALDKLRGPDGKLRAARVRVFADAGSCEWAKDTEEAAETMREQLARYDACRKLQADFVDAGMCQAKVAAPDGGNWMCGQ